MTEQEWLRATDPRPMLRFLGDRASDRKLRLFAVACCRRIWHLLTEERSRRVVEVAERFADGLATEGERGAAERDAFPFDDYRVAVERFYEETPGVTDPVAFSLAEAAVSTACAHAAGAALFTCQSALLAMSDRPSRDRGLAEQSGLLRCVFGNPFRRVALDPAWRTWQDGLVVLLARRVYESRDFGDLPVLADALEEAGCSDPDVLNHCRMPGEHVRGCWVVDLVLGKS